ncbi:OLC1v1015608C1 [Oldenlandia corymbosa var. corymbosa]|uniref:OLC1v1015608C1 n=1 Tax=Oldenlandia corymbosa var. corymbosa TaxID=529605 RepID=A0AAV1E3T9_OLDCO|nr:OLC1v1015608C1 [Oldenlandia corymbosa var. corymbosa]
MASRSNLSSLETLATFIVFFLFFLPSQSLNVEVQALLDFKSHLVDPLNHLDSWHDSDSPCLFYGVTCDKNTGLVTEISLDEKSLSGFISPSISVLQSLTTLWLPSNALSGVLPEEIINCTNLKVLNVTGNNMNGTIPDLSTLTKLEILDLSVNYFSGGFPTWAGSLINLVSLGLGDNDYDEGEVPANLGNLKNLTWLYLAGSNLIGAIPDSIFELQALGTLDMCRNKIIGDFPRSINKLRNLWKIELYQNNLTGQLPLELAELSHLQEFDISLNQMHGTIPPEIGNLKYLTVFHLHINNFSGEFPPGFGDMQHLNGLSIYRNSFSGPFPENLGRYSPLNSVDISENQFSGGFPRYLCQNGNLEYLLALQNNFSGELPDNYADCKALKRLRINLNQLSGNVPAGLWALPYLEMIDFSDNNFNGTMSPGIGDAKNLNQLILTNNRFSGNIPKEVGRLVSLERLYLNNNSFSGLIPSELGGLKQISFLHLEENSLRGSIPVELSQCSRLVDINLASNQLNGVIPKSLASMSSLNSLNLSNNQLIGLIPVNLGKLKLSLLDLSYNLLSGFVPSDLLRMGGDKAFSGNKELCIDDSTRISMNSRLDACSRRTNHQNIMKSRLFITCFVLFSVVLVLAGLLLVSYCNFKHGQTDIENMGDGRRLDPKWKLESFHQIELEADELCDLDEDNLIGSGATGKVYRLDLKKGCGTVAVKELWKGNAANVLAREMEILGKIRHRNIVKLYACLSRGGSHYLVLEFMENGNLFQALHREIKIGRPELDWSQRYRIALGAAKGIAYLHHDCFPSIIHRDIKSTNILLDEDYEAKIADFGLAKVAGASRTSEFSYFAGTHGYLAPEMAYTLKVTEKSDIYSFGVVLLELITGRKPIEDAFGEGKDIVYWVSSHLSDRKDILKVLDPKIACDIVQDDMIKVLRIATLCTAKLPNLRPSMKDIVKMLMDAEPLAFKSIDSSDTDAKLVFLTCSVRSARLLRSPTDDLGVQVPVNPSFRSFTEIVGGNGFVCALSSSSSSNSIMVCWRFSINGNSTYKRIYTGPRVEELDSGKSHICGLIDGNSTNLLECWQSQNFRSTGNSSIASNVAVGENFVCGLSKSGQLQCLGSYTNVTDHVPAGNYSVVAAGSRHVCAISTEGSVECWGDMVGVKPSGEFIALALGDDSSCFLRLDGKVFCFGANNFSLPNYLQETLFVSLEAKGDVFCGLTMANYSLYCWRKDGSLSLNSAVFEDVVPGKCRKQCPCDPLPNYGRYCSQGMMICLPCIGKPAALPPSPPSPSPELVSTPQTTTNGGSSKWNKKMVAFMVVGCFGSLSLVIVLCYLVLKNCKMNKRLSRRVHDSGPMDDPALAPRQPVAALDKKLSQMISMGSPLEEYSLETLLEATNSFSEEHKIGTGSFGSVYMGRLPDGSEIAIKRADISSATLQDHAVGRTQRYKAIHMNENGVPRNVVDFVVPYIVKDDVHRVLDPRVHPPTPIEIEAVAYVGYLAADCVTLESPDRPTMTEVVNRLERALAACLASPNVSRSTSTTPSE